MSLLNSLFSGVSGLRNHQAMMDTIGSNIANVNSIGYKGSRVTFSDTFNQFVRFGSDPTSTSGGSNTFQIGLGMKINAIDRNWNQGTFERTGITTDLALQGNALFVLNNNNETFYSRAGTFALDSSGNLVNTGNGGIVQGKLATDEGEVPAGNNLVDIKIDTGKKLPAVATTDIKWGGNLEAGSTVTQTQNVVHTGNLPNNAVDATPNFVRETTIYNDYGDQYKVRVTYDKTGNPSEWNIKAEVIDPDGNVIPDANIDTNELDGAGENRTFDGAGDIIPGAGTVFTISDASEGLNFKIDVSNIKSATAADTLSGIADNNREPTIVEGSLSIFDSLGNPHTLSVRYTMEDPAARTWNYRISVPASSGTLDVSGATGTISFNDDGSLNNVNPQNPAQVQFTPSTGAAIQAIKLDFGTANGFDGITQTSSNSVISALSQNGSDSAVLTDFNIDQYGFITGVFSNGQSRKLAQILLAKFTNNGGLTSVGDNMFTVSANSGTPVVAEPGETTGTTIQSGALEQSNVDLSEEFTRMIVAQRGFQANARVVTSSDTLLQEVTNLVR
ncbi:MAG: flagellar hook protein FlgE [Rhodothermaceae bacterium]